MERQEFRQSEAEEVLVIYNWFLGFDLTERKFENVNGEKKIVLTWTPWRLITHKLDCRELGSFHGIGMNLETVLNIIEILLG